MLFEPDGNPILLDHHVPSPRTLRVEAPTAAGAAPVMIDIYTRASSEELRR